MKIIFTIKPDQDEPEVIINCSRKTPEVEWIQTMLNLRQKKLQAVKDGRTFFVSLETILYIESVDRKTFLYADEDVYEYGLSISCIERDLENRGFVRASKSCLIQLIRVKSIRSDKNHHLCLEMDNGEKIIATRKYARLIREKLCR